MIRKDLSPTEKKVMRLISLGCTNRQAGAILGLSEKTVDNHRTRLMKKYGIHNTAALVRHALSKGITSLDDALTAEEKVRLMHGRVTRASQAVSLVPS